MIATTIASAYLKVAGWRFEGDIPTVSKYVCLATPHTSNWDGLHLVMLAQTVGLPLSWMIKSDWVKGPMGVLLERFGAVAVDRSQSTNLVQQMIDEFARRDELVLAIPPEGTRGRTDYWKSGFYHIAVGAGVPVVPGYLDFARKRAGLGPPMDMTGDVRADMDRIRAYYERGKFRGKHPDQVGRIRLREEDAPPADA